MMNNQDISNIIGLSEAGAIQHVYEPQGFSEIAKLFSPGTIVAISSLSSECEILQCLPMGIIVRHSTLISFVPWASAGSITIDSESQQ